MTVFIALLRAINVGGTGMLPMKELAAMCTDLGFEKVRTYIQSGNVVFQSALSEKSVRAELEQVLATKMGKKVDVIVRTAAELRSILNTNPFPEVQPAQVAVIFMSNPLPKGLVDALVSPGGEEIRRGKREIYIHYPNGMGRSKLKIPTVDGGSTARNINTVAKLVAMTTA
jgi:uncharacterized protein (DUF1697 family)